ncbi:hypothetical protein J7337_003888 [Fusarium musae]|uniref:Uncharacterized protein n=1 Tax=Fusarium musae TaxID=1042133 RepID=A0A9P8ISK6_9HYPO|nr:hypothetical protein J7337_003888 [Fusarium musae]KAG9503930.1 hypothetical protein J7337_003888 [Fusarium musae]
MVVQLRSRGKAGGSSAEPEATPSTNQSRVTRSKRANTPLGKLPSPAPRKHLATDAGFKPLRRSRRKVALKSAEGDEQPQLNQEHEEASEGEGNALPEHPDLMTIINSNILDSNNSRNELPQDRAGRRMSGAEAPQTVESDENFALDGIQQEQEPDSAENNQVSAPSPEQPEAPHEEHRVSGQEAPPATQEMAQINPSFQKKPLPRKRRRQSQKPPYGAPGYNARGVSPELGSALPEAVAIEASTSQQVHAGGDYYDVPSDGEQPSQPILSRRERETHGTQAEHKRKTKQGKRKRNQHEQQNGQIPTQAEEEPEEERNEEGTRKKYKNGDQDGEYENADQDGEYQNEDIEFDDNEPAAEHELDISDLTEDSLLLDEPPSGSQTLLTPTAWVKRDTVQKLVRTTAYSGWMNGRKWKDGILALAKAASEALEVNRRVRSRLILGKLHSLHELCKEIPSSSNSQQLEYFREHTAQLSSLYTTLRVAIDEFISSINTIMEQGDAKQVGQGFQYVAKLHRPIIPMLVLVLDRIFEAGRPDESTEKREFTVYTLEPLERTAGWIQRLSQVVESWYELYSPRRERDRSEKSKEHRRVFRETTKRLKASLEKARERIDAIKRAPIERKRNMQKDEAIRREREADAQRRREIQDMQMQRFLRSMQKVESSQARPSTTGSYRGALRFRSVASQPGLMRSQEPSDDDYFEKHGWHYWEDDHLLSLIRTTSHPNYKVLHRMLPNRDPDELKERSDYLRMVMRDKYERKGIQPPRWCVAED